MGIRALYLEIDHGKVKVPVFPGLRLGTDFTQFLAFGKSGKALLKWGIKEGMFVIYPVALLTFCPSESTFCTLL